MSKKSQIESEQPAKVYQLDAVESKVDTMIGQLDTILKRTDGLVTIAQLDAARVEFKEHLKSSIQEVHSIYGPTLRRNKAIWVLVGVVCTAVVGQAIIISLLRG